MVSNNFLTETRKLISENPLITFLDFTYPLPDGGTETLYFSDNNEPIKQGSNVYNPFPFYIRLPKESSKGDAVGEVVISNATLELVEHLMTVRHGLKCRIFCAFANALDTAEIDIEMNVIDVDINKNAIVFKLRNQNFANEIFMKPFGQSDLSGGQ